MASMDYSGIIFIPRKGMNPKVVSIKEFEEQLNVNFCGKTGLSHRKESLKDRPVVRPWDLVNYGSFTLFRLIKINNIGSKIYYGFYGYQVGEGWLDTDSTRNAVTEMLFRLRGSRPSKSNIDKFINALKLVGE